MDCKLSGKENVHASRFGFTAGTKPKASSAAAAAPVVPHRDKNGAASTNTDPYNLRKMALEAMPDNDELYHEVLRKHKQANKGKAWDHKSKCARAASPALCRERPRLANCRERADACRAEKNEDLIRTMKELLNTMREQVRAAPARLLLSQSLTTYVPRALCSDSNSVSKLSRCKQTWAKA